jgi:hypothetical protein
MGRVETMLLHFCTQHLDAEDDVTRMRIARKCPAVLAPTRKLLGDGVWHAFHRRNPGVLREAASWSRVASRLLAQFDSEYAMEAVDRILHQYRTKDHHETP